MRKIFWVLFVVVLCFQAMSCRGSCVCSRDGAEIKGYRNISKKDCEAKTNKEQGIRCVYE